MRSDRSLEPRTPTSLPQRSGVNARASWHVRVEIGDGREVGMTGRAVGLPASGPRAVTDFAVSTAVIRSPPAVFTRIFAGSAGSHQKSAPTGVALAKVMRCPNHTRGTEPVWPLRCLATISSAAHGSASRS